MFATYRKLQQLSIQWILLFIVLAFPSASWCSLFLRPIRSRQHIFILGCEQYFSLIMLDFGLKESLERCSRRNVRIYVLMFVNRSSVSVPQCRGAHVFGGRRWSWRATSAGSQFVPSHLSNALLQHGQWERSGHTAVIPVIISSFLFLVVHGFCVYHILSLSDVSMWLFYIWAEQEEAVNCTELIQYLHWGSTLWLWDIRMTVIYIQHCFVLCAAQWSCCLWNKDDC